VRHTEVTVPAEGRSEIQYRSTTADKAPCAPDAYKTQLGSAPCTGTYPSVLRRA